MVAAFGLRITLRRELARGTGEVFGAVVGEQGESRFVGGYGVSETRRHPHPKPKSVVTSPIPTILQHTLAFQPMKHGQDGRATRF